MSEFKLVVTMDYLRGEIIRAEVRSRGWSAREFGVVLNRHEAHVSAYLRKGHRYNTRIHAQVMKLLGWSDDDLTAKAELLSKEAIERGLLVVTEDDLEKDKGMVLLPVNRLL